MERIILGYLETAHFADCPEESPLALGGGNHYQGGDIGADAFTKDAIKRAEKDCAAFLAKLSPEARELADSWDGGSDFWYTRNGHGVGFWESDRGWGDCSNEIGRAHV